MSSPLDDLLSLSKLRQGHLRKSFEDSVDEEKRVDIGCETNSRWKRGELFWKAKGPMADTYKQIGPRIQAELNQARTGSYQDVGFSLFMVGETKTSAKPIIIIYSTDEKSRKAAKKAIKDCGILVDTDFEVRTSKHPPSGRFRKVAMEDGSTPQVLSSASSCEVFFDPGERIRLVGMPIYIKHRAGPLRQATANAVYNGVDYGYVTAAHALDDSVSDDQTIEDDGNLEFSFDRDSDDERDNDMETDILSRHSNTSPETTESERSSLSLAETLLSRGSDIQQVKVHSPLPSDQSSLEDETSVGLNAAAIDPPPTTHYRALGSVSSIITHLDCGLITVTDTEVISILEKLAEAKDTIPVAEARATNIIAWTSHGPIEGNLDDTPVFMRLRNSPSYELVHTFTYQYDGGITMGDCGTLITDADSGALYGHVIADSENTRLAYMVAAERTVHEIGHWQLLASGGTQLVGEWIKSPSPRQFVSIVSRHNDSPPITSVLNLYELGSSSHTNPRTGLMETTPIIEKAEVPQADVEISPASLTGSLQGKPAPQEPDKYSSRFTAAKELPNLETGAISSLFQAFAGCIQGYELIIHARDSRYCDEAFFIRLKLEELKLIDWARSVGLDYTDHNLLLSPKIKKMLIGTMEEQQKLICEFGREYFSETEEDFVIEYQHFFRRNFRTIRFPHANDIFKKVGDYQLQFKKTPRRLKWSAFDSTASAAFIGQVTLLHNALGVVLDEAQSEKLYEAQTRTNYQILLLNQDARILYSILRLREAAPWNQYLGDKAITRPSGIRQLVELASLRAMRIVIEDWRSADYIRDMIAESMGLDLSKHDIRESELSKNDLFTVHGEPLLDFYDRENVSVRTDAYYKDIPVWIEWELCYSGPGHTGLDSMNRKRIKTLAALLKAISESKEPFRVPCCLGYFSHEDTGLSGLVFQTPELASTKAPVTLYTLFTAKDTNNDVEVPSLTDRITLMRLLCESIEGLHAMGWLHGDLRSANILFFKDSETNDITITDPYVSGFDYTDTTTTDNLTVRSRDSSAFHIYRHPSVQQSPRYFKMSYDIYALGLLLLEIAYWKPLNQILEIDLERVAPEGLYEIKDWLLSTESKVLKYVKSQQGDVVENVIRICLEGPEAFDLGDDFNEESVEGKSDLLMAFGEKVVIRLKQVKGL